MVNLEQLKRTLEQAGVSFSEGLSPRELDSAEAHFGFVFPPDLREFLTFAMPVGEEFPNWRDLDNEKLARTFAWPLEGLWFDAKQSSVWLPEWGPRPAEEGAAYEHLRALIAAAPTLIPIRGHRYLPGLPLEAGNPVLSVYQTDIICYGVDLEDYFANEYPHAFGRHGYALSTQTKTIPFWASFLE